MIIGNKKTTIIFIKGIPNATKILFKAYCAKKGSNMSRELVAYMEKCVAWDAKK